MNSRLAHTYSIVGRDPKSGEMGVAVQSHFFSVGSVVAWGEAGVGVVATQSMVKIDYGPHGLALMREGVSAEDALARLMAQDEAREVRQVAMLDATGGVATHTGSRCIPDAGHLIAENVSVQANMMENYRVWPAMLAAFQDGTGQPLADRLLTALAAAQAAGGDIRGQQSAALLVVDGERQAEAWRGRQIDLRVEEHPDPVTELQRLLRYHQAYRYASESDELMARGEWEAAKGAIDKAVALVPDEVELRFWAAHAMLMAGREGEALPRFAEVFAEEPQWAALLPRLVPAGLLPEDPALIQRILDRAQR